jgi:hypothetical protein
MVMLAAGIAMTGAEGISFMASFIDLAMRIDDTDLCDGNRMAELGEEFATDLHQAGLGVAEGALLGGMGAIGNLSRHFRRGFERDSTLRGNSLDDLAEDQAGRMRPETSWTDAIDFNRLFSGGTIGSRSDLRNNLIAENPELGALSGWQAHHILPWEDNISHHPLVQRLGVNLNAVDNGIPLPCRDGTCLSRHSSQHPRYSRAVLNFLDRVENMNVSDNEKQNLVAEGIERARQALISGNPPLMNLNGATVEAWDQVFNRVFN